MKPRGFWGTFITEFVKSEVIIVLPMSLFLWLSFEFEFIKVLIGGSILIVPIDVVWAFYRKAVTISWTFQDKEAFLKRLNTELDEMDYRRQSQTEAFLSYKPSIGKHGLFAPKIYARFELFKKRSSSPYLYLRTL